MRFELLCPACGVRGFDFDDYESLVLLAPNLALAQFKCPGCGIHLSATLKLSPQTQHIIQQRLNTASDVQSVVDEATSLPSTSSSSSVHPSTSSPSSASHTSASPAAAPHPVVDTSNPSLLSYASSLIVDAGELGIEIIRPLRVGSADIRAHLEYFKRQLDDIETVDEAIEEIDTGYFHERRDV